MSGTTRTVLLQYVGALALTVLAVVLRLLIGPLLGDRFPLITLFAAVVVAWYAGRGPALLSLLMGGLAGDYFFLHPRYSFTVGQAEDQFGLVLYSVVGLVAIGLFESLRNARRRAEEKGCQLEKEVAARRTAQQELAEEGERLRTTLGSIGDAVITTSADGRIAGLNPVAEALTGWTKAEATGQPLDVVFRIVNEETRQAVENPATRALSEGVVVGLANHTVLIARDGSERPIDDSAAPIRATTGQIIGCVLVFRDISERRCLEKENASRLRAAHLLATIVESSDDAIISKSLDGIIQSWNAGAERLFGFPAEQAVGRHVSLIIPADRLAEEDRIIATLKAGQRIEHFDTVRLRNDGQPVLVSLTISPIKDETGRVIGASKIARDITGQRQAEERERRLLAEAAAANAQFRATFEQAAVGIAHVAPDGRWLRVNQRLCDIVGYSHDELMEASFQDITHPDDLEADLTNVRRLLAGETATYMMEKRYVRKDLSIVWAKLTVSLTRTPQGEPDYFISVVEDISQRKEVEEQFRTLADTIPQLCWMAEPNGHIFWFNSRCYEYTGKSYQDLEGWGWEGITDPEALPQVLRQWGASIATGEPLDIIFPLRGKDGQCRPFLTRVEPIKDAQGRVLRWFGTNTDISEAKKAEEALRETQRFLRSSLDALGSHIAVLDESGVILEVNEAWRRFADENQFVGSGYGVGTNYLSVCENAGGECGDGPDIATGIREVMQGRRDRFLVEYPCHSPTEQRWFTMQATRFQSPGPVRVVVAHVNVTERRRAEDALRDADRRKDEFLATLAHELRNPLAPIRNALQILRLSRDREAHEQARTLMERQVGQMVHLVDDLLDVSRIGQGKLELRQEQVSLAAVVGNAVETSRPLIDRLGHELTVTLPPQAVLVDGDPTRLAQVFANLLNNAAKYMDRGGHIWLTAERQGSDVLVSVRDAGIGIAAEQLPRIFQMYSQVDSALGWSQGGLGIGLTLVKRLVEMHGGRIEARSEGPGKGSEFVVRLPAVGEAAGPQSAGGVDEQAAQSSSLRILIVDDNRDSADSLGMLLRIMGSDTRTAYDGQEGVDLAGVFRPDVVLLDIGLPKLDGHEACRRIRKESWGKHTVLIAMTGWGQEEDRRRSHEAGFDHHMVKPVAPQELMKLLADFQRVRS